MKPYLQDPYMNWAEAEGIPVHLDFGHDLLSLETKTWDRYDARGCFAHTHGRGDFCANYVIEVDASHKTRPVKHLYDAFFYVLTGHGSATIWLLDGNKQTFEWGPNSFFAIPLNCQYQLFNTSGVESARLSCTNDAPLAINHYHNLDFIFNNPCAFPERIGNSNQFEGEGELGNYPRRVGDGFINVWETNFVPDLTNFKLYDQSRRGKGARNVFFQLADSTMHSHMSEIPVGRYKKAHRHSAGTHVHCVSGEGYSLLWYEGDQELVEIPWKHGYMYTPPLWMFHQHFNTSGEPARYLACSMGSARYPFTAMKRKNNEGGGGTSLKKGGQQIEFEDQDPRIHLKFLESLTENNIKCEMEDIN